MRLYFAIFHSICFISVTKLSSAEEGDVLDRSPLLLAHYKGSYEFPQKVYITEKDQIQEYFYRKLNDSAYFCPSEEETNKENTNNDEVNKAAESVEENKDEENTITSLESSGKDDNEDDVKYQYCLFEKQFDNKGEKNTCEKQVKPLIVENRNQNGELELCGSESRIIYKFAYEICVKKSALQKLTQRKGSKANLYADVQYPFTYEICYDHVENRVIFTKHRIKSSYMIRNLRLDGEHALHDFSKRYSTETYGLRNLENLKNILKAYRLQAEDEKNYHLERLVPKEDFALGHWIKTTLHIINYSPQHKSKIPLWKTINSHVRARLIKLYEIIPDVKIFTGTWGELLRDDQTKKRKYLGNDRKIGITIPSIWWKILYSPMKREAIAIIMHNDNSRKKICEENTEACDVTKWQIDDEQKKDLRRYVYCCGMSSAGAVISTISYTEISISDNILKLD